MAALFLLALGLVVWEALRTQPVQPPAFEVATLLGERVAPLAVPSWRSPFPELPREPSLRLAILEESAVDWPRARRVQGPAVCEVFLRLSAYHWARRSAPPASVARWLAGGKAGASQESWRRLYLPVASFLDDDDGDGDCLDAGELEATGQGAEVEIFCGVVAWSDGEEGT